MKYEKDEMCGAIGLYGGEKKFIQCFGGEIGRKVTSWKSWP
jgi:hypothetical protein